MGMLKRMQDMKEMVNAAPGMVAQSQQLAAQAQQMAAAQQAALQAQMAQYQQAQFGGSPAPGAAPAGPDFEPIAGVSLEQFAAISKGVAAYNYDATKLPEVAASHGRRPGQLGDARTRAGTTASRPTRPSRQQFNQLYRAS